MRRSLKRILLGAVGHLQYIPAVILKVKNWFPLLITHFTLFDLPTIYVLRNGVSIATRRGVDAVTLFGIFIRRDYGDIEEKSVIIDIGANIGIYSLFCASQSKNTRVYAYEPSLANFNLLLENIRRNGFEKCIYPFRMAVAARREKRRMYLGKTSAFHSLYTTTLTTDQYEEVDCITLKDIFEENTIEHCDILKFDCEGAEFECLYYTPPRYFERIKRIRLEYHISGW